MDAYEQVKVIGKGSFGVVTQIVRKADGKVRALFFLSSPLLLSSLFLSHRTCA